MKFSNSSEESIIVLLNKFVQMDASNVACVVLDDDEKNIEIIFLQSRKQRDWSISFLSLLYWMVHIKLTMLAWLSMIYLWRMVLALHMLLPIVLLHKKQRCPWSISSDL